MSRHNRMPLLAMTMDPAAMGAAADKTRALGGEHAPKSQHQFCFYSMALLENFITVIRTLSFASNHTGLKVVVSDDAKVLVVTAAGTYIVVADINGGIVRGENLFLLSVQRRWPAIMPCKGSF